jgi:hypothetical protein
MRNLKHLVVDIYDDDDDFNPLFGIPSELEDMRNNNIIEIIEISVTTDINWRREDDWEVDWGRLDEVLTALGWFSLKRVSLRIRINRFGTDGHEPDVALQNLIMRQFPRLSSSNSVSFDFKVNHIHE